MRSFHAYIFSIHYGTAGWSVLLSLLALVLGLDWRIALAIACLGVLLSRAAFYVQPLQCFAPTGGNFNVGVREVLGDRGAMRPPVTIIYPTASGAPWGGIDYIPFREKGYLEGLAAYSKIPYLLVKDLLFMRKKMRVDAPPVPLFQRNGAPRPMVVFSHGLGGFPHLYSTLLMNIAARGVIVFAMTHMDGSAAFCRDAGHEIRIPLNIKVRWTSEDREPQLEMRIRETLNTVKRICNGDLLRAMEYDEATVKKCIESNPLVHLVGHSFGGSTCLASALEDTEAAKAKGASSSIASAVVYDPWMVPLQKRMFYERLRSSTESCHFITPTLQFFSEEWMRNEAESSFFLTIKALVDQQEHTKEEAALVAAADAKLKSSNISWYTLKNYRRTGHLFCTDVPLFNPVFHRAHYMTMTPQVCIVRIAVETAQFLDNISGPLPIDISLLKDPVLAEMLRS
ncbi:hypothetical protein JKF63_01302 [Porcisia hertigi]|uniref:1-alkyl-2-acetylglycerophosphocholine esterase n=1 Tax=Porcisia hertigi TaxID=2761500 RepID=A0A836HUG2_9TRYP|nr:hypothetical protein JKF63_01302 [Porcisia hertigi]